LSTRQKKKNEEGKRERHFPRRFEKLFGPRRERNWGSQGKGGIQKRPHESREHIWGRRGLALR